MSKGRRTITKISREFTIGELADAIAVLRRLLAQTFDAKRIDVAYRLAQMHRTVGDFVDKDSAYEIVRRKLAQQHGKQNERSGEYEFTTEEGWREFTLAVDAMRDRKKTLSIPRITAAEVMTIEAAPPLTFAEWICLEPVIDGDAEDLQQRGSDMLSADTVAAIAEASQYVARTAAGIETSLRDGAARDG